mgnify:CR=1 FL=1
MNSMDNAETTLFKKRSVSSTEEDKASGRFGRCTCCTMCYRTKGWACDFVTSPIPFLRSSYGGCYVLRSLSTWTHSEMMIWFTRELLVSLCRYSAEDDISASFCLVRGM